MTAAELQAPSQTPAACDRSQHALGHEPKLFLQHPNGLRVVRRIGFETVTRRGGRPASDWRVFYGIRRQPDTGKLLREPAGLVCLTHDRSHAAPSLTLRYRVLNPVTVVRQLHTPAGYLLEDNLLYLNRPCTICGQRHCPHIARAENAVSALRSPCGDGSDHRTTADLPEIDRPVSEQTLRGSRVALLAVHLTNDLQWRWDREDLPEQALFELQQRLRKEGQGNTPVEDRVYHGGVQPSGLTAEDELLRLEELVQGTAGEAATAGLAHQLRAVFPTGERHDRALLLLLGGMPCTSAAAAASSGSTAVFRAAVETLAFTRSDAGWAHRQRLLEALAAPFPVVQATLGDEITRLLALDTAGNARPDEDGALPSRYIRTVVDRQGEDRVVAGVSYEPAASASRFLRHVAASADDEAAALAPIVERAVASVEFPPRLFGDREDLFQYGYLAVLDTIKKTPDDWGRIDIHSAWFIRRVRLLLARRMTDAIRKQGRADRNLQEAELLDDRVLTDDPDDGSPDESLFRALFEPRLDEDTALMRYVLDHASGFDREIVEAVLGEGTVVLADLRKDPEYPWAIDRLTRLCEDAMTAVRGVSVRRERRARPASEKPQTPPAHADSNGVAKVAQAFAERVGTPGLSSQMSTWLEHTRQLPLVREICRRTNGYRGEEFTTLPEVAELLTAIREDRPAIREVVAASIR